LPAGFFFSREGPPLLRPCPGREDHFQSAQGRRYRSLDRETQPGQKGVGREHQARATGIQAARVSDEFPGQGYSRAQLPTAYGALMSMSMERTVDVHVGRLPRRFNLSGHAHTIPHRPRWPAYSIEELHKRIHIQHQHCRRMKSPGVRPGPFVYSALAVFSGRVCARLTAGNAHFGVEAAISEARLTSLPQKMKAFRRDHRPAIAVRSESSISVSLREIGTTTSSIGRCQMSQAATASHPA